MKNNTKRTQTPLSIEIFASYGPLLVAGMLSVVFIGCDGDGCKSSTDCSGNEICINGSCVVPEDDSDSDTTNPFATDNGSDPNKDTSSMEETDTGDDSDTASGNDTETDPDGTGWSDGHVCEEDADCQSRHCDSGYCCAEGDCCKGFGDSSDCEAQQCAVAYCDGNFMCQYNPLPCGAVDLSDATPCDGDNRCNGDGECLSMTSCDNGAFASTGTYQCSETSVVEACYTDCTDSSECQDGYRCIDDSCVVGLENGDAGCTENMDCISGICDLSTTVCCETGLCCQTDADCGDYACDEAVGECLTTCRSESGSDDDEACSEELEKHCDNSWCYDNLDNGEQWCDEHSDCASDYCDPESAICCESGQCCVDDEDCDSTVCMVGTGNFCAESCTRDGADDNSLCQPGLYCESGACVGGDVENGGSCEIDEECVSSHCQNGFCCGEGECCASADDCTADLLCNTASCTGNHECEYYPLPCNAIDFADGDVCLDADRCDGFGNCVEVPACEGGYLAEAVSCSENALSVTCATSCGDDEACDGDFHCESSECVPDIISGEGPCDSNLDCVSGNCNALTAVCCDSGYCCDDNSQCSEFDLVCDETTHSCLTMCTEDSDCAAFGDYHCEGTVCEPDILNGETYCFEASMCLSEYCDTSTGICCDSGACCQDDADCAGFICSETFSCVTDCAGDDDLCASGYFCNQNSCEPQLANGGACDLDSDCASGNCDLVVGICCDGTGACCNDVSDCDDDDACTNDYCSTNFSCYTVAKTDGESCSDGLYCNGVERCDGGVCTAGDAPCTDSEFCMTESCDEENDTCTYVPRNEGQACSEEEYCLGGVARVCSSTGLCVDPGTGTPPCTGDTGNSCTTQECDEDNNECVEAPVPDGTLCDDDPCNGNNACEDGECVAATTLPCDDDDPCTTDECTNSDGVAVCGDHTVKADGAACDSTPCMGDGATCWDGTCVDGNTICGDGMICTVNSCYALVSGTECSEKSIDPIALACGESATVTAEDFATQEVSEYGGTCSGTYPGLEAAVSVTVDADVSVTLAVSNVAPSMDLEILQLTDWCDAETCVSNGTNTVVLDLTTGEHVFVLEAPLGLPPDSVDVSAECL